jgi:hypothetical protein
MACPFPWADVLKKVVTIVEALAEGFEDGVPWFLRSSHLASPAFAMAQNSRCFHSDLQGDFAVDPERTRWEAGAGGAGKRSDGDDAGLRLAVACP